MQMNQVAIAYTTNEARENIKKALGLTNERWVKDTVKAEVTVRGRHGALVAGENVAELEFCMAMGGQQFELVRYKSGPNWIDEATRIGASLPMVAHVGFHLEDGEAWPPAELVGELVQEAFTREHANKEVGERRYHYRIYRLGPSTYFKFIRRVEAAKPQPVADKPADKPDYMKNTTFAAAEKPATDGKAASVCQRRDKRRRLCRCRRRRIKRSSPCREFLLKRWRDIQRRCESLCHRAYIARPQICRSAPSTGLSSRTKSAALW